MNSALKPALLAAAALALGSAAPTSAQPRYDDRDGYAPRAETAAAPANPRRDPQEMRERRAERLRAVLQLRREQEPALQALLAASQPRMDRERRFDREAGALSTPQRLERMRQRMTERQAAFERRADATMRFYDQLDAAQRRAFDALGPMGGKGGHSMRGRGGRYGGRGPSA